MVSTNSLTHAYINPVGLAFDHDLNFHMGNSIWFFCHRKDRVKEISIKRTKTDPESVGKSTLNSESCPNTAPNKEISSPEISSPEQIEHETFFQLEAVNYLDNPPELSTQVASSHLVRAQQKLITKLELELASVKNEVAEVKNSYEKKLKKSFTTNANLKAESALLVFELKDKIKCLEEENNSVMNKLYIIEDSDGKNSHILSEKTPQAHTELILSLSEQLVAANDNLSDAKRQIESLTQTRMQTDSL